jgi:hypothetical protein
MNVTGVFTVVVCSVTVATGTGTFTYAVLFIAVATETSATGPFFCLAIVTYVFSFRTLALCPVFSTAIASNLESKLSGAVLYVFEFLIVTISIIYPILNVLGF